MFTMFMLASGYFSIGLLSDDYLNIISANTSTLSEKFTGDVPYYSKNHLRPIWFLSIQTTHAITNALGFANDNFQLYRIENLLLIFCFTFVASHLIYRSMKIMEKTKNVTEVSSKFSSTRIFLLSITAVTYSATRNDRNTIVKSKKAKTYLYLGYFII